MKKKLFAVILVLTALVVLAAIPALAADNIVYVSGTGSNTNSGLTPENPVKDLSTAVGLLPNGGTIVLVGDVSTEGVSTNGDGYTLPAPANGGKITITGSCYGKDYGAALKIGINKKGIFEAVSPVEFKNITIRQGYSGACAEFYTGPSMKFGEGVVFLNAAGKVISDTVNGNIAIRVGAYNSKKAGTIASARLEMVTGTISYIQGGNNYTQVTDSTVILHEGVKLIHFLQCGGTNQSVGTAHVTINGARMPALYLNGYGSAGMTSIELEANNADLGGLYDGRVQGSTYPSGVISGDVDVTLRGCKLSAIDMDYGIATTEGKTASLTIQDSVLRLSENSTFYDWDALTLHNSDVYVSGAYAGPKTITTDANSVLRLYNGKNDATTLSQMTGNVQLSDVLSVAGSKTYQESLLMSFSNESGQAVQGTAVHGNYAVQCFHTGVAYLFDMTTKERIAQFNLGSYDADGNDANHANQAMFGATKFKESDPLPLLYVSIGNNGDRAADGFYGRCAVERIYQENGEWKAECVQIIVFNDNGYEFPKDSGGRFTYSAKGEWANTNGYQRPCWGWPASFVDSDPTADTAGKFYLHSARYRTKGAVEDSMIQSGDIESYAKDSAYIITEFDLPTPPTEATYTGTAEKIILTPESIVDQFEVEYDVYITQGGTMYQGRIYYPFGFGGSDPREKDALRVYDIAQEKIIAKIDFSDSAFKNQEPECCFIYNGKLGLSTQSKNYYLFDYIESLPQVKPATCTASGSEVSVDCLSGNYLRTVTVPMKPHSYTMTWVDATHYTLTCECGHKMENVASNAGELSVVYLDGTLSVSGGGATPENPVKNFTDAYARLSDNGGTIVVMKQYTISDENTVMPVKAGTVTITSRYNGTDYRQLNGVKISFNATQKDTYWRFNSSTVLQDLTVNRYFTGTTNKYTELVTGPDLVIGYGMEFQRVGVTPTKGSNAWPVRLGYFDKDCPNAELTILSGTVNYIQGGNKWADVGDATINIGGDAVVTDFVQCGATYNSASFSVDSCTVNITGVTIPELYLGSYGNCTLGSANVTITDAVVKKLAVNRSGTNTLPTANLTLTNATVEQWPADMAAITTANLTYQNTELESYDSFAAWESLSLKNSTVRMMVKYEGPASVAVDKDSILYISGDLNAENEVPAKSGEGKIVYLVASNYEQGDPITMKYDDRLDLSGKTVLVFNGGTPTSYQVGYGVTEGTKDLCVVKYDSANQKLIATGIGTAKVVIGDKLHEVTVEPAPISLFLMIGQSNMAGAEGDKTKSVINADGQVYSTFGSQSTSYHGVGGFAAGMTESNAPSFVASALAGEYSTVAVNGSTTNMNAYPLYALTAAGLGKHGIDSGFAYEWTRNTGEKVWLVNAAEGGTSINTWVPGKTNYKEAVALFRAAQQTLGKEIAAGHYTLSYMGYLWCQGCADRIQTADWYINKFTTMHEQLKQDLSYDFGGTTGQRTLESANMILVRACGTDGANSQTDVKEKEYHTYKDLEMNGVRVAQYYMANSTAFADVHMVSNLGDSFVYWDDAKTISNVKQIFEERYPQGIDYTIQVGTPVMPEDELDVHKTIHYSQIGYNEVGREAARNLYYRLNPDKQPAVEESVKLLAWDGYTDLAGRVDTEILTEEQIVVPVAYPLYRSKELTVSGHNSNFYEITGTRTGTVTATLGDVSVTYTLNPNHSPKTFRWELAGGTFATVSGEGLAENALQLLTGAINADGTLNKAGFRLSESVVLLHDQPWAIEWKGAVSGGKGSNTAFMLMASSSSSNTLDAPHILVANHSIMMSIRSDNGGNHFEHYRHAMTIDMTTSHTYALVNRVNADGSNMIYLYVDGVEQGALDERNDGSSVTPSDWVNGRDFVLSHIGAKSSGQSTITDANHSDYDHTLVGSLEYLQARENRLTKVEAVAADCENPGNILYYLDNVTGELYADAQGINPIADANGDGDITIEDTVIAALDHSFTNYVSNNDATCTADGTETAICDRDGCNEPDTRVVANSKLDHSFTNYVSNNDATCTADGTETAICDRAGCNEKDTKEDVGSKLDHSFTDYKSNGDATCTADGTKTAKCDRCDETDTVKEAAHGHKLTKVAGKAATCTEEGVVEHYTCSVCKKNFSDAEGKTALSTTVIPSCHNVEKVEGKAPTATENGQKEHYGCASCGKVYADAEGKSEVTKDSLIISATNAPTDTGDDFYPAPVVTMMILSLLAMAVMVIKRKEI